MVYHTRSRVLDWLSDGKEQTMKYLKATDSNGTELYLFQLEGNCFISIPKEQLEFKPLSPEELKDIEQNENPLAGIEPKPIPTKKHTFVYQRRIDNEM